MSLQTYLVRLLRGDHAHLGEPAPTLRADVLRSIARRALARVDAGPVVHGRWLVVAHGLQLLPRRPPSTGREATQGDVVAYDPMLPDREASLLCAHGCAHRLLDRQTQEHEHSDVWLLTAMLLVSSEAAHTHTEADLERVAYAPEWLVSPARTLALSWEINGVPACWKQYSVFA